MFVSIQMKHKAAFAFWVFKILFHTGVVDKQDGELVHFHTEEVTYLGVHFSGKTMFWLTDVTCVFGKTKWRFNNYQGPKVHKCLNAQIISETLDLKTNIKTAVLMILPNSSDKLPDCSAGTKELRHVTTKKQHPRTVILNVATEICFYVHLQ